MTTNSKHPKYLTASEFDQLQRTLAKKALARRQKETQTLLRKFEQDDKRLIEEYRKNIGVA